MALGQVEGRRVATVEGLARHLRRDVAARLAQLIGGSHVDTPGGGKHHHASGAPALRVRVSPFGDGAAEILVADAAGAPVATVGQLALRPIAADQLSRTPKFVDRLFQVDWREVDARQAEPVDHEIVTIVTQGGPDGRPVDVPAGDLLAVAEATPAGLQPLRARMLGLAISRFQLTFLPLASTTST